MDLNKQGIKNLEKIEGISLPVRRQPVRTTFRISKEAHDAIKHVSKKYNMKNPEVFDTIVSIFQEFRKKNVDLSSLSISGKTARKTYLINKSTLLSIEKAAMEQKISRDLLINSMSLILKLVCDKERSNQQLKYEQILKKVINPFLEHAEKIEKELIKELGKDDPVTSEFGVVIITIMNLVDAIQDNISNGTPIKTI